MNSPTKIDLYYLDSAHASHFLDVDLLSISEKIRYESYKYETDAKNFLIARVVLKTKLAEKLCIKPQEIELSVSTMGKPFLDDAYKQHLEKNQNLPHFSIAHCEGAVAVAISSQPVGVDVENIKRPREPWRKAGQLMNSHVAAALEGLNDAEAEYEFARYWTCLEAYVKLLGSSLAKERANFVFNDCKTNSSLTFSQAIFRVFNVNNDKLSAISYSNEDSEVARYNWLDKAFVLFPE